MSLTPPPRVADPLLDEIADALSALPLSPVALVAVADAAGAPVPGDTPARAIVEAAARLEGGLVSLLDMACRACPEAAAPLAALTRRARAPAPPSGARAEVERASQALGHAWTLGQGAWVWQWTQATRQRDLARRALASPALTDDPDRPALERWADAVDASLSQNPARLARLPGAWLAARLARWPALAASVYTLGQLGARAPRLWPLGLLLGVMWALFGAAPGQGGVVVVVPPGALHGLASADVADPAPARERAVVLPPAPSTPTEAPLDAPPPRRRARDRAPETPSAAPERADPMALLEPVAEEVGPQGLNAGAREGGDAALSLDSGDGTGRGGTVTGSGTIRHTALPDVAPMAFLGVNNLPPPIESPEVGEVWVAQTEVTEGQWMALRGLDFAVLTGRADRPAEHMTWCEALDFANRLSRAERLRPVYELPRGCERGVKPTWRPGADGYRLPTEAEWEAMVGTTPGWGVDARAEVRTHSADALGLYGVAGNAAEFVWAGDGVPVLRHRSCAVHAVETDALWPEGEPLLCRFEVPPGERVLGGGLRLVRDAPDRQG